MTASVGGRVVLKLTKKYGEGPRSARPMVTTYLAQAEYDLLAALPAHPLTKRRYAVGAFSIDQFEGKLGGLELAESEQPDAQALAALAPPDWAVAEVSDDLRYEGGTLALADGMPIR
jgi:CYTH domain-containing protein